MDDAAIRRLIQHGIRINCTSPGAVQTPMLEEIETKVPRAAVDSRRAADRPALLAPGAGLAAA